MPCLPPHCPGPPASGRGSSALAATGRSLGVRDGMGRLHRGGSCSSSRVRARGSAPRPGRGGGPRRLPPDPLAASFLFPVGDVGAAAPPAGDLQGLDPRPGRVDSRRDGCVRRGRDLVRWARAGFGAVIDLVVSQVCKERCRRWGQKRACRAHLSEVARDMRADRTGTFSPSSPRPRPPRARAPMGVKERADMGGGGR